MIKAVIYDMDGVLINTEPHWRTAEIQVFEKVGISLTVEDCLRTLGYKIEDVEAYWYKIQPWKDPEKGEIAAGIVKKMIEFVLSKGEPMKGVYDSLNYFKSLGVKIGLASSSHMSLINAVLDRLEIRDYFEAIHSGENEQYGKPHPSIFINCAKEMGVSPEDCLIIEDSPNGVIAARASKAKVIAIPEQINIQKAEINCADMVINDLTELNEATLKQIEAI